MKNNSNFKTTLLAMAFAGSTLSVQAYAADDLTEGNQSAYSTSFKSLDVDNSTTLTKTEAKKEKLFQKHFKAADIDNDGTLDEQEYTNYKTKSEKKEVKRVVKDSVITSKVKGNLLKDEGLKSLNVKVKTNQGVVLLSGFVETADQIQQAGKIAADVEGVNSVENSLLLKKD